MNGLRREIMSQFGQRQGYRDDVDPKNDTLNAVRGRGCNGVSSNNNDDGLLFELEL